MSRSKPDPSPPIRPLKGKALFIAHTIWWLSLGTLVLLLAYIVPRLSGQMRLDPLFSDSYAPVFEYFTFAGFLKYVVFLRFTVTSIYIFVAVLIFARKSNDRLAILTSLALLAIPYLFFFGGDLDPAGPLRLAILFANIFQLVIAALSIPLLLLTFPDGIIKPRFIVLPTVLLALIVMVMLPIVAIFDQYANVDVLFGWFILLPAFLVIIMSFGAQLYRYFKISDFVQRQQTRWIVFSLSLFILTGIPSLFGFGGIFRFEARAIYGLFQLHLGLGVIAFLPVALGISILRYRLYEIDLIIRRTLQYTVLTGILLAIYFGFIISLQGIIQSVSGQTDAPILVVFSTLFVAAIFNPLKNRVQRWIDQRFFRSKYDAEIALTSFANTARDEVDMDKLADSLLSLVETTIQPVHASLWLQRAKGRPYTALNFSDKSAIKRS